MAEAVQNGLPVARAGIWSECPGCANTSSVPFDTGCRDYPGYRQAAHAMIYALDDRVLFNKYKAFADIMMQVRFDGLMGFGGGLIDDTDETIVDGLNRELAEEINLDLSKHRATQNDHIISHACPHKKLVTHFYAIEVTVPELQEMEKQVFFAHDWGTETLGVVRVPLHTMEDGDRGLPLFLTGQFAGNSKHQLITTLRQRHILPAEYLDKAVARSKQLLGCSLT